MKVLHLNAHAEGGAARACLRLHRALLDAGVDSNVLLLHGENLPNEKIFSLSSFIDKKKFSSLVRKEKKKRYINAWKVRLRGKPAELFTFPDSVWQIEKNQLVQEADIIHLHWVSGMIDVSQFFSTVKKPIVWTMHDAWPYTGGFHYENYFNTLPFKNISKYFSELKSKFYSGKNFALVFPSNYLLESCRKSKVFSSAKFFHIPNGMSTEIYHQLADQKLPAEYGVKDNSRTWFFAAEELSYYRKGADLLVHAFQNWKNKNVQLLIAGKKENFTIPDDERIKFIGRITDEKKMCAVLSAVDAVICSSREDNQPNLIVESFFCGTPVFSTPVGGIPEMINENNGLLIDSVNIEVMQKGFDQLLGKTFDRNKISSEAQVIYSASLQAGRYLKVYEELI